MAGIDLTCSICLLDLTEDNKVLPCLHTYHSDCLRDYVRSCNTPYINCPDCRREFPSVDTEDLPSNIWVNRALDAVLQGPSAPILPSAPVAESDEDVPDNPETQSLLIGRASRKAIEKESKKIFKVSCVDDLRKNLTKSGSALANACASFKKRLLDPNSESACLPLIRGVKIASKLSILKVEAFGCQLQSDQSKCYEALFVFALSHAECQRRGTGIGLTNNIIRITQCVRALDIPERHLLASVLAQCQATALDTIAALEDLVDIDPENRANYIAGCLNAVGLMHASFGEHKPAVVKYEESLSVLDHACTHPDRYAIYGTCFFNKAAAAEKLLHLDEALTCYDLARSAFKKATNFPSRDAKNKELKKTEHNMKVIERKLASL